MLRTCQPTRNNGAQVRQQPRPVETAWRPGDHGSSVDVEDEGDRELTYTFDVSVEMTTSGRAVDGTLSTSEGESCTGSCDGFEDSDCSTTASFTGTRLRDVEPPYESLE